MRLSKNMTKLGKRLCAYIATITPQHGPNMPVGEMSYSLRHEMGGVLMASVEVPTQCGGMLYVATSIFVEHCNPFLYTVKRTTTKVS